MRSIRIPLENAKRKRQKLKKSYLQRQRACISRHLHPGKRSQQPQHKLGDGGITAGEGSSVWVDPVVQLRCLGRSRSRVSGGVEVWGF